MTVSTHLSESAAKDWIGRYGVQTPVRRVVAGIDDALRVLAELLTPLAVKVVSGALHKSDIGGVRLGVQDAAGMREAVTAIERSAAEHRVRVDGFLIEEMPAKGVEILVGGLVDAVFGPAVVVGLGGVFTEVFGDVTARICPIDADDAREMIEELNAAPLLFGTRGQPPADVDGLVAVLVAIGGRNGLLVENANRIREIDLNPVIVSPRGAIVVDARVILREGAENVAGDVARDEPRQQFRYLFEPRSIAIVGASNSGRTRANDVLDFTRAMGFRGPIYPIHPTATTIGGLPAYRSFAECPGDIDYAFVAIGAARVPDLLDQGGERVRFAQIMASGFSETAEGEMLNRRLLAVARERGVRLIGPNCLGTYSPRGRLTYIRDCPVEPGPVAFVSQSGGISTDMLRRGVQRGLRYSGVVSVGNCADLGPADFLEHFLADAATGVIGFYLESLPDGRRFFETLRYTAERKPVVILKGGRTPQGQRAALSHTGALAGDDRLWTALSRQTGAAIVSSVDELIDTLIVFQCLQPRCERPGDGAFVVGNGGGASVLATDLMTRIGMRVPRLGDETRRALQMLDLPAGTSLDNPMDTPSGALRMNDGRIAQALLATIAGTERSDAILFHVNMPQFLTNPSIPDIVFDNLVDGMLEARRLDRHATPLALTLRSDGSEAIDARKRPARDRALRAGVPVFDEIANALVALAHFQRFERFWHRRQSVDRRLAGDRPEPRQSVR